MRLHRLRLRAFGPFAETAEVDFDALTAEGLFLIQGPTGSGKTSLLDAVCFALFADVPGDRSKKGLRSDHASPDAVPVVELEMSCGDRRVRIRRSPEFQRPKKRGTGTVKVQAMVTLEELRAGTWEALSTRHDEAAEVIDDLVGMGKEQFAKVVMLPQGEFAAFLRATPEARRALLERLFDITVYADIEEWLATARREAGAALDQRRAALEADVMRVVEVIGQSGLEQESDDEGGEVALSASDPRLMERLDAFAEQLSGRVSSVLAALDDASMAEQAAAETAEQGRARERSRARGIAARSVLAELATSESERAEQRLVLGAAERAATVAGHLSAIARERLSLTTAETQLIAVTPAVSALAVQDRTTPAVSALVAELAQQDEPLADLVRLHREVQVRSRRAKELAGQTAELEQRAAVLEAALSEKRAELEPLRAVAEGLVAAARAVEDATHREGEAVKLCKLAEQIASEDAANEARRGEVADARETAQNAREQHLTLHQRRIEGMAAELAATLSPGDACPVCGSDSHPSLAQSADPVTADDVAAAEAVAAEAAGRYEQLAAGLSAAVAATEARRSGLPEGINLAQLRQAHVAAADELEAARASVAKVEAAAARAVELNATIAEDDTTRAEFLTRREVSLGRLAELASQSERDEEIISTGLRAHADTCLCQSGSDEASTTDPASVESIHRRMALDLQRYVSARAAMDTASSRVTAAQSAADEAAVAAEFRDAAEAAAALRPADESRRLRSVLDEATRSAVAAEAVLAETAVVEALSAPAPDLPTLEAGAKQRRAELLATTEAYSSAQAAARTLDDHRRRIAERCSALGPAGAHHERLKDLADTMAGLGPNNALRMRLTSFVLAARLEKVVDLANERLRVLGQGRYLLEHSDGLAGRGARSGLGLRVLDQWTGNTRETSTLSGGEAFMASLALALGLADAVREESGGRSLGTLFIDEGFGSLDDDSLEEVLGVLDGLREGGRAVGVVSHVPELRNRITSQVIVAKTATGSSVRLRTAASDEALTA